MSNIPFGKGTEIPDPIPGQIKRFWDRVNQHDSLIDCWDWTGPLNGDGYGKFNIGKKPNRKTVLVHRLAYFLTYGDRLGEMTVDHICKNRACCNPAHLRKVPHAENCRHMDVSEGEDIEEDWDYDDIF